MRVLVCGSRNWDDDLTIKSILNGLYDRHLSGDTLTVIEGGARGADRAAAEWADNISPKDDGWNGCIAVDHEQYPADWEQYGRAAGPIRNKQMLVEGKPDVVWAFSDDLRYSKGTANMVGQAKMAGVPVYVVSRA